MHTTIKYTTSLLLLFVFLFFTAAKSKQKPEQQLLGKWKYISGSGGFTGKGPGWNVDSNIYFEFKKAGKFKKIENKKITATDTYQVQSANAGLPIKLSFKKQLAMFAVFNGDTLQLQEDVADGFTYIFVRRK